MPLKLVRVDMSDARWMTDHLKSRSQKRQDAFHNMAPSRHNLDFIEMWLIARGRRAKEISI